MTENTEEKGPGLVPDRGTFSFDDFVAQKATTPLIRHTAYLGNEAGQRRADIEDEIQDLQKEINALRAKAEKGQNRHASIGDPTNFSGRIEAMESRLELLREEFDKATAEVLDSAMTFHFQWKDMDKPKEIIKKAQQKWCEREGVDPALLEGIGSKLLMSQENSLGEYISCALAAAAAVRVEKADGSVLKDPLQVSQIEHLALTVMLPNERERLFSAVGKSIGTSADWFRNIDAGFPG